MALLRAISEWSTPHRRLTFVALILWSLVIAVAAGESPADDAWLSLPDLTSIAAALLLGAAAGGLLFILILKPPFEAQRSFRPFRGIGSLVVVVAVGLAIVSAFDESLLDVPREEPVPGLAAPADSGEATGQERARAGLGEALLLGLAGLAAVAVIVWSRRNASEPTDGSELTDGDQRLRALEDAVSILEEERDPRRAVLFAYASLERELTAVGLHRHRAETPTEYLRRVLVDLPRVVEPATRLSELYLVARYSEVPIQPADRDSARTALNRATAEMAIRAVAK